jgi:hypothetical protein
MFRPALPRARDPMPSPHALFEVSWEVCNKVGGIHTVVSTKAKTLVSRFGDDYVAIGPWLLSGRHEGFEEEQGFDDFCESCRALGIPVRVGRWKIPGRPLTILVEFSGLFAKKDGVLAGLWEHFKVDSLFGGWDYDEPVLFGHAAGIVIEKWFRERLAPRRLRAVAQFHEWMTAAGLFHLKKEAPEIGTVFTTHATILGRSISAGGKTPEAGLEGRTPEEAAEACGVRAKHSMESIAAREADVFTTVSEITAREAELFHHRRADPLLPNGIDLAVIDELAGAAQREQAESELRTLARRMCGEDLSRALLLCASGRYEFHNKGLDVLLDALALVDKKPGKPIVLFALVPAGHSGIRSEVLERLRAPLDSIRTPDGLCTHNLFDAERDPIARRDRPHPALLRSRRRTARTAVRGRAARDGAHLLPVVLRAVGLHARGEPRRRRADDHDRLRRLRTLGAGSAPRERARSHGAAPRGRRVRARRRAPRRHPRALRRRGSRPRGARPHLPGDGRADGLVRTHRALRRGVRAGPGGLGGSLGRDAAGRDAPARGPAGRRELRRTAPAAHEVPRVGDAARGAARTRTPLRESVVVLGRGSDRALPRSLPGALGRLPA